MIFATVENLMVYRYATVVNLAVTGIYGKMDGVAVLGNLCDSCKFVVTGMGKWMASQCCVISATVSDWTKDVLEIWQAS